MSYAWIIDRDLYADGKPGTMENAVGITGPKRAKEADLDQLKLGKGEPFRMFDDDNNLIYEGRFIGDADSEDAFGPLDDFGTPNFGCTYIKYRVNGSWEQL